MWIHWPFFPKTWTKGHWPLDDLWPHVCWGHMCDSTQGSLCPSPMTIHQCMWIQWSILQNTTLHIHTTYILHTYYVQNEWSHSLLLNSVQARQKVCHWCFSLYKNKPKGTGQNHVPRGGYCIVQTLYCTGWVKQVWDTWFISMESWPMHQLQNVNVMCVCKHNTVRLTKKTCLGLWCHEKDNIVKQ